MLSRAWVSIGVIGAVASGCAGVSHTAPAQRRSPPSETRAPAPNDPSPSSAEPDVPEGIFHVVKQGQTLWRIARAYGVTVEELAAANKIEDVTRLETERALFVPRATSILDVLPAPAPPPPMRILPSPEGSPASGGSFEWPVPGGSILSYFDDPRRGHRHAGVDIRGESGQEILAARAGRVVFSGEKLSGYGKLVILDHGDGMQTLYAHGMELLVKVGDWVERGQAIARVGKTGNATTEHCHFEIRKDRLPVDPLPYLSTVARARP